MPKNPADAANVTTEEILNEMESEITSVYAEAHAEMVEKLLNFLFTIDDINDVRQIYKFFRMKNKMKLEALKAGRISQKEYNAWKAKAIMAEKSWLPVQQTLADDLTHSREIAASIINDRKCDVYALNYNYATYEIEKGIGASTSFALYDHDTVERLIAKNPKLLPTYSINNAKDAAWNAKHIRHAVTQGILQGESNQAIAARMQKVCNMSENASIRTARTATTCAQNSGRIDGYKRAQEMGIDVRQIWISTLDGRTRHQHRELMGQKREVGKPFQVDGYEIMFPGDPNASAFLVYNCRCTLIADVDGANYDLENRIEQNLKEKDLTWDEWIKEQPLPRHYGESKKDYLKRYKEHHKKMKFSDWLEEQAMPDILITKAWSDKKMSNIYNMIKEKNITDANKFYKELGKLGKPSEVWNKYLLGQLDAIDLKQFEEILKKYLPKETTPVANKTIAVHQKAIEAEKQIKYTKSDPMSFDDADMHHVNPGYKGNNGGIYAKNCQTCAMTYEARRQGYDVVALGKDPTHSHTYALQTEVGKDQAVAWINKTTGEMPVHLECSPKLHTPGKYKFLEDTVGHNGERYTLSVRWKGGGAHVINMDRDANGVLRLIDNQRGPNEKHIWTGEKEIKQYLDSVKNIKYVLRVDDCIPNPKYFNMITKEAKIKIKPVAKPEVKPVANEIVLDKSLFKNKKMSAVYTDIKKTDVKTANQFYKELQKMGKPSDIWDKYLKGQLSDVDVQKIEKHLAKKYSSLEEATPGESVTGLDIDTLSKKKVTNVYDDLQIEFGTKEANAFYKELKNIANAKGYKSQSAVWKKYLNGELDFDDIEKIDKYVIKKYKTTTTTPGIEPAKSVTKADLPDDWKELYNSLDKDNIDKLVSAFMKNADDADSLGEYYLKWKNGKVNDQVYDEILLGIKPGSAIKIDYDKLPNGFLAVKNKFTESSVEAIHFSDTLGNLAQKYNCLKGEIWEKYKKKELSESEMKQIDDIVGKLDEYVVKDTTPITKVIDYNKLPDNNTVWNELTGDDHDKFLNILVEIGNDNKVLPSELWDLYKKQQLTTKEMEKIDALVSKLDKYTIKGTSDVVMTDELKSDISKFLEKIEDTDPELAEEIWKYMDSTYIDTDKAWTEYWDKKWSDPDLDDLIKQTGYKLPEAKVTTIKTKADLPEKVTDLPDQMKVFNYIHANGLVKKAGATDWVDYYKQYKEGFIDDPGLDKILGIGTTKSKVDLLDNYVDTIHHLSDSDKVKLSNAWAASGGNISPQHYYTKWKNGEIQDPVFDEVLLGIKSTTKTASIIDYDNLPGAAKVYQDLIDNISEASANNFYKALDDATLSNESVMETWEKYKKKQLTKEQMEKIDKTIEPLYKKSASTPTPKPSPASVAQTSSPGTTVVDMNALNKKVTAAYNKIKDEIGTSDANKFYNELKKIGKDTGIGKQSDVWNKYLLGQLDADDVAKIDKHLIKIKDYTKVEEPIVPVVDIDAIKNKKMSQFYNELKAENTSNANKFYNELKKHGKPSEVWTEYIKGELPEEATKKIDEYVIKKYSKGVKASAAQKQKDQIVKIADGVDVHDLSKLAKENKDLYDEVFSVLHEIKGSPGTNWKKYLTGKLDDPELDKILVKHNLASDDVVKKVEQQKELDAAKEELEKAKAALPENKKYSGIWKDEVSLSDYTTKKNTIAAKKVYLEDELQKAKDLKNQNPHQPGTSQYDGYIKWNESQIEKFEKLLVSIDEFERLGKEYEKAQKVVEKAQKKVNDLTPEAEMYSQERKENAKWYTHSQYRSGDAYYTKWAKPIHATATSGEHSAYYSYTSASGRFNRPLAGFKSPKYSGGSGWDQQYFKGVGKVPLDNEGAGTQIRNLTTFIEKSKTKDDIWIQTAQNFATLEGKGGFLDIPYGKLSGMSDAELQQFVGIENQLGQFVSGSINRGGGSYTPGGMRINIYCPKGSEALYVLGDGAFGKSEHEIILQRGGTYKITKMYWGRDAESGGRKLIVDMELRLEKGYNKYGQ